MMTREEELARAIEDRDILEIDSEILNERLKELEENSDEWDDLYAEITATDNQIQDLNSYIHDLELGVDL